MCTSLGVRVDLSASCDIVTICTWFVFLSLGAAETVDIAHRQVPGGGNERCAAQSNQAV